MAILFIESTETIIDQRESKNKEMEREIIRNRISEINTIGNANKVLMP